LLIRTLLRDWIGLVRSFHHFKAAAFNPGIDFTVVALEHRKQACRASLRHIARPRPNPCGISSLGFRSPAALASPTLRFKAASFLPQ
jgi:hypothetical protein